MLAERCGVTHAAFLPQSGIRYDRSFRDICAGNGCGQYGRCYMCPPDVGEIDALIAQARTFPKGLLYQTIHTVADSFDIEGMLEAGRRHAACVHALHEALPALGLPRYLHLGAGHCGYCARCAKLDRLPCRAPSQAVASLEAYGIFVSETARAAGLRYINGVNTITYFGLLLYEDETDAHPDRM